MPAAQVEVRVRVSGNRLIFYTVGDQRLTEEGTAKIDPTSSPKSVDLTMSRGSNKGKTALGVYEVKGDTYRLYIAWPGNPRPRALEPRGGRRQELYTFKRVRP